jgi:hypothetical protein
MLKLVQMEWAMPVILVLLGALEWTAILIFLVQRAAQI